MIDFLKLSVHVLLSPFNTRAQREAEIVLLRHQLNVLRRRVPSKPKLALADRLLFVWLYRLFPSVLRAVTIIQRDTIIVGIGRASACTGAGSHALLAAGQKFLWRSGA
jgi:putative transposase